MSLMLIGNSDTLYTIDNAILEAQYDSKIKRHLVDFDKKIKVSDIKKEILMEAPDFLVISLRNILDIEDCADFLYNIHNSTNIKTIIDIESDVDSNSITSNSMKAAGAIILDGNLTTKRETMVDILNGEYIIEKENILKEREENLQALNDTYNLPELDVGVDVQIQIAVVGGMERIGTTTLALQLVNYIKQNGKRACYVEHNNNGYIKELREFYNIEEKKEYFEYKGIHLYDGTKLLTTNAYKEYDYVIHDYGNIKNKKIDKISVLNSDIVIVVAGIKANEIAYYSELYKSFLGANMFTAFNFVSERQRADVLEEQDELANKTFFLEYTPDPFTLSPNNSLNFPILFQELHSKKIVKKSKLKKFLRGEY